MNPKSWTTNWRGFYYEMDKRRKAQDGLSILSCAIAIICYNEPIRTNPPMTLLVVKS